MEFKAYDILSSLIPGFLVLLGLISFLGLQFEKEMIIGYTAIAFLLGYIINTLSSWLEDFYNLTWGGKPSTQLLKGKNIWKVHFYQSTEVVKLLTIDIDKPHPSEDELFSVAMRCANGPDTRVADFNALYAFSRAMLTTTLISYLLFNYEYYDYWRFHVIAISLIVICWLRCKQRGYYYAKEVLTVYLKSKKS